MTHTILMTALVSGAVFAQTALSENAGRPGSAAHLLGLDDSALGAVIAACVVLGVFPLRESGTAIGTRLPSCTRKGTGRTQPVWE